MSVNHFLQLKVEQYESSSVRGKQSKQQVDFFHKIKYSNSEYFATKTYNNALRKSVALIGFLRYLLSNRERHEHISGWQQNHRCRDKS